MQGNAGRIIDAKKERLISLSLPCTGVLSCQRENEQEMQCIDSVASTSLRGPKLDREGQRCD